MKDSHSTTRFLIALGASVYFMPAAFSQTGANSGYIVDHLATPPLYDNAPALPDSYGQSFISDGQSVKGVEVYFGRPDAPDCIDGTGELVLLDLLDVDDPVEIGSVFFDGASYPCGTSEPIRINFINPIATDQGGFYAFLLKSPDPFDLGLRNQYVSTYDGGSQVWLEGELFWSPYREKFADSNSRDLSFAIAGGIPAPQITCIGFSEPANVDLIVKKPNRVIPLSARFFDEVGQEIFAFDNGVPVIQVEYQPTSTALDPSEAVELDFAGRGHDGNTLTFDGVAWSFNWKTKGVSPGTYSLSIVPGSTAYDITLGCSVKVEIR